MNKRFVSIIILSLLSFPDALMGSLIEREGFSIRFLKNSSFIPDSSLVTQYKRIVGQLSTSVSDDVHAMIGKVGVFGVHALLADIQQPISQNRLQAEKDILGQIEKVLSSYDFELDAKDPSLRMIKDVFLLRATSVLVDSVVAETLSMLDILAVSYKYWIGLQGRHWYYFLHKSPKKWFLKKTQDEEIREMVSFIAEYKKKYHYFLGRFVQYVSLFDPLMIKENDSDSEAVRVWVRGLVDIVRESIFSFPKRQESSLSYSLLLKDMRCIFLKLDKLQESLQKDIKSHDAQKPGHFTRNWLWYVGIGIAGYVLAKENDNNGVVQKGIDKIISTYNNKDDLFNAYARQPFNRLFKTLFRDIEQSPLPPDATVAFREMVERSSDPAYAQQVTETFKELSPYGLAKWGVDLPGIFTRKQLEGERAIGNVGMPFAAGFNAAMKELKDVVESQRMTLAIGGIMPITLVVAGMWYTLKNVYGKITDTDYSPLRLALCDVEDILIRLKINEYNQELYGELLHKLHELRAKAQYMIPRVDGMRIHFLRQIYLLESVQFSSDDKRAVINSLRERYAFLRLQ